MFDEDEPGRKAAKECAQLFSPGKAFIAHLPMKDPNEMLMAGRGHEIIKCMWDARPYNPDGIISGADTWELLTAKESTRAIATPWNSVNELTHGGFRTSEITMVCAGTGIGKSQLCRQFAWNALKNGERVAYIALEETVKRSVQGILSLEVGRPLHLESDMKQKEVKDAWESTIRNQPIYFYDHWGSADSDNLINKIRYLAKGCDVSCVVLDHISIIVSDIEGGDERRIIDNMMTKFAGLVIELGIALVLVCHVRKSQGKSFEEGGQIGLDDLRGSGSLKQLSWTVVGLERDQQGKDPNVATVRILKNRTVGETGVAGKIKYDPETTMLNEYDGTFDDDGDEEEEI
jgi:twinkle protein